MLDLSPTNWYGWRGQVTVVDHQSIQAFYLSLIQILNDQPTRPKSIRIGVTQLVHHEVGADKGEGQREKGIQQTGATEVDPDVGIADVDALWAPRRFVWKPTATIGGGRSAVWACGQVAERLVHMPMRPCSA